MIRRRSLVPLLTGYIDSSSRLGEHFTGPGSFQADESRSIDRGPKAKSPLQAGDKFALAHREIGSVSAVAVEDLVELELFKDAPKLGDCVVVQVDARIDVRVIGLGYDEDCGRTLGQMPFVAHLTTCIAPPFER